MCFFRIPVFLFFKIGKAGLWAFALADRGAIVFKRSRAAAMY
jgi:hypothetical protein